MVASNVVIVEEDPVAEVVSSSIGYCRIFTDADGGGVLGGSGWNVGYPP